MDRNEKQNSFRNTRRTRGESKSIQKLKRRLRLTTVFAVVMLAAFLGSLTWLKISNDASQKTIDEQRREIAILNDDIKKMKDQEKEKDAAEGPEEETSEEGTDAVPEEETPKEGTDAVPEEETPKEGTDVVPEEESPEKGTGETPEENTPDEENDDSTAIDAEAGEADRTDEAAEEADPTGETAVEENSADKASADAKEDTDAPGDNEVNTQETEGSEDKQIRSREYIFRDIEKLLNEAQVSYRFACDIMYPDTLDNKVCFQAGQLEDKESKLLQNLILLSAYEKQLREINQKTLYGSYGIKSDYKDHEIVLSILQRQDTIGIDDYAFMEPEYAKRLLIARIGYIEYLRNSSDGQFPIYSDENDEQYKVVEENLQSGIWNAYSDKNADEYMDYGYKYIQDFLEDDRYLGEAVCDEDQAKKYYGKDAGYPFAPQIGMSLMEHLNIQQDDNGPLWISNREQFLKGRLNASYITGKSTGSLVQKMKDTRNDSLWWIEDTDSEDGENPHSYVYMMFPCNGGNQWCVSALFIDGGELNEDQAGKYCDYLLEMAETPAPDQEEMNDAMNSEMTSTTPPPPAENPDER